MKVPVTLSVRERAAATFAPDAIKIVCAELAAADLPLINNNGERVHMAILHLASGDLDRFRLHLAAAKTDWRNVLIAAGSA